MYSAKSLLIALVALLFATNANAQQRNCGPRAAVIERLAEGFGESRQSIGIAAQGRVVEVFASEETGTWSITVTLPNGMTCLVASGEAYETLDEPLQPAGIQS